MKFSACIPAYKADATIQAALESVSNQTETDWEIIVVEDGPGQATQSIVHSFAQSTPNPVSYEQLTQQQGVAAVRNRLLQLASGDAIAFLDADDLWKSNHLENIANLQSESSSIWVAPIDIRKLEDGMPMGTYKPPPALLTHPALALFEQSAVMTSSSIAFRATVKDTVGFFDTNLRIGEDRDYWLRAAIAGFSFGITDTPSVIYHKHSASAMAATPKVTEDEVRFYQKHQDLQIIPRSLRRKKLSNALWNLARLRRKESSAQSRQLAWKAWKLSPSSIPRYLWTCLK